MKILVKLGSCIKKSSLIFIIPIFIILLLAVNETINLFEKPLAVEIRAEEAAEKIVLSILDFYESNNKYPSSLLEIEDFPFEVECVHCNTLDSVSNHYELLAGIEEGEFPYENSYRLRNSDGSFIHENHWLSLYAGAPIERGPMAESYLVAGSHGIFSYNDEALYLIDLRLGDVLNRPARCELRFTADGSIQVFDRQREKGNRYVVEPNVKEAVEFACTAPCPKRGHLKIEDCSQF